MYTFKFAVLLSGPVLLEDYHLIEKLAQFDRERIPERVVHARGATAKGFFEVSHSAHLSESALSSCLLLWLFLTQIPIISA